ncbi:MAG: glycosyltransferase family 39 protein [Anaerolineae bacterium]|nr:glycosyltransferase family 39 protein [Anaerolineae bacterium]
MSLKRDVTLWVMMAVLLLAAAARIINVNSWPVWTDEAWSIWAAHDLPLNQVIERLVQDRHPPAYFLALNLWSAVTGDSRLALRFLNILAGILTVAVTYRIGAETFGRRAGVFGALFLAVLSFPVYYSQEVRHYGWLTFAVSLMSLAFLRVLRRPSRTRLIVYGLTVAFMLYVQYLGALLLAVQGVYVLFFWRVGLRAKGRLASAWALAALCVLPWLLVMAQHLAHLLGSGGLNNYPERLTSSLDTFIRIPNLLFDGQFALLGAAYAIGAFGLLRDRRMLATRHCGYVALGGSGLYAAMFVVNHWVGLLAPRGMVFLLPLIVVVCGAGLARLPDSRIRLLLVAFTVIAILGDYTPPQPRIAADAIAEQIASESDEGDLIVLEMDWDNYAVSYELERQDAQGEVFLTWRKKDYRDPDAQGLFSAESLLPDYQRVWVVQWLQPPQTLNLLQSGALGFRLARWFDVPLGDQYGTRFEDRTATVALFEQVDSDGEIALFGDQLALRDAVFSETAAPGDTLLVDLWWAALQPVALDYSVGVYLMDESSGVVAQHDAAPGDAPTSQWASGGLVFDRHRIALPDDLPLGRYALAVSTYWYADPRPLPTGGQPFAVVGQIEIVAG